jgi:prevent-host-death family protein
MYIIFIYEGRIFMPIIRPSSDLRNNYNEISTICHQSKKPVYITKNGAGDLAVMSIELYELLIDKYELYKELEKGINSLEKGEVYSADEVYDELEKI